MNIIQIDKSTHKCPDKWAEMEPYHLLTWVKILSKKIALTDAFALAAMLFYRINKRTFFKISPPQLVQLKNTLAFLAEDNLLTKWVIPVIKVWFFTRYYGPEDRLATSTIQEFRFSESYYMAYQKTKDPRFIDQLIATLYRKKGENKLKLDCRKQISQLLINQNAPKMRRLDKATRAAILFNYEGCRQFILKKYPSIFKLSKTEVKSNALPDLENIIKTIAGGKFGTFNETQDTSLYVFFDHLSDEIENAERSKL